MRFLRASVERAMAAPHRFPYREQRTLEQVDRDEAAALEDWPDAPLPEPEPEPEPEPPAPPEPDPAPESRAARVRPTADMVRHVAEEMGVARPAARIDWKRVAEAHRRKVAPAPDPAPVVAALPVAPSADPCPRCGVAGWRGCAHFAPCEPPPIGHGDARRGGGHGARHILRRQG